MSNDNFDEEVVDDVSPIIYSIPKANCRNRYRITYPIYHYPPRVIKGNSLYSQNGPIEAYRAFIMPAGQAAFLGYTNGLLTDMTYAIEGRGASNILVHLNDATEAFIPRNISGINNTRLMVYGVLTTYKDDLKRFVELSKYSVYGKSTISDIIRTSIRYGSESESALIRLLFVPLHVFYADGGFKDGTFANSTDVIKWLVSHGFKAPDLQRNIPTPNEANEYMEEISNITNKTVSSLRYPVHGAFLVPNNSDIEKTQFVPLKNCLSWPIAMLSVTKEISGIDYQTGEAGRLERIIGFYRISDTIPVTSIVERGSIENGVYATSPRIGDSIGIQYNESTGAIEHVPFSPSAGEYKGPTECPSCGTKLVRKGNHAVCVNTGGCAAQLISTYMRFLSPECMGFSNWDREDVMWLINAGYIKSIHDLLSLPEELFDKLESLGKSNKRLYWKYLRSLPQALHLILYGLGVGGLSPSQAIALAAHFHSFKRISEASADELQTVLPVDVANAVFSWVQKADNLALVEALRTHCLSGESRWYEHYAPIGDYSPYAGLRFIIKGEFSSITNDRVVRYFSTLGARYCSELKNCEIVLMGNIKEREIEQYSKIEYLVALDEYDTISILKMYKFPLAV